MDRHAWTEVINGEPIESSVEAQEPTHLGFRLQYRTDGGQWYSWVPGVGTSQRDALCREILRLAEEVARLKEHVAQAADVVNFAECGSGREMAAAERARIGRELRGAIQEIGDRIIPGGDSYYTGVRDGRNAFYRSVLVALDRIVPGEG